MSEFVKIREERFRLSLISSFEVLPVNPFTPNVRHIQIKFSGKYIIIPFWNEGELKDTFGTLQKLLPFVQVGKEKFIKPSIIKRYKTGSSGVIINGGEYKVSNNASEFVGYLDKAMDLHNEAQV